MPPQKSCNRKNIIAALSFQVLLGFSKTNFILWPLISCRDETILLARFNNVLHELMTSRITVSGCLVSISLITLLIASLQYFSISISLLPFDGCEKKRNIDVCICILPVGLAQCSLIFLVPSKFSYCTRQL